MNTHLSSWKRVALFLASLLIPLAALAQTSWKGTVSTDWNNAANWTAGVPSSAKDAIIGDASFTGSFQPALTRRATCKSLTLGNGSKASVLSAGQTLAVSGGIVIGANGTLSHNGRITISLTGNWTNSGVYTANNTRSTVTFSGGAQSINGATAFRRMTINSGSTTVLKAGISVANRLSVSGTFDPGESPAFTVSGGGTLTVNSGAKLLVKAATFAGNYALTGTKTLNAASTVDYAAVAANQTVSSSLTYGTLRISGGATKSLTANLPALNSSAASAGNVIVASGTLDLASFTANRGTSRTGGSITLANGANLIIGGTRTFPSNYATHALGPASTVVYSGGNQTLTPENYGNLTLASGSGASVKTLPAAALTIAGNLTATVGSGTSLAFTAGGAMTVRGNVTIGPAVTFSGGGFAHGFGGSWVNDGTYAGGTGSATFTGAAAAISGGGTNGFNDLVITGSGVTTDADTSLTVAGNLSTSGAGSFIHSAGGPGTLRLSGSGKTVNGNGISLNHLSIPGSIGTVSSLQIQGNLSVPGSLVASNGTFTLTGTANTVSGPGAILLSALNIPGNLTTSNNFSVAGDLSVSGSFSASAGTATFTGNSILSGTARLFNVTLAGNRLQLGAGSLLGVAGNLQLSSGSLDVTTTIPNTIDYDGNAAQTVRAIAYHHLSLSGGGTKTADGDLTANGDLLTGAGATFAAGSFTHSIAGNWMNLGTFSGTGGTIRLVGTRDTSISGATTFDALAVAKSSPASVVSLHNNTAVSLVNMTGGSILTGPNTLTITTDRTGNGIILGTIIRSHPFSTGIPYAFEGPNNTITFASLTGLSSVTVTVTPGLVPGFPFGSSINRRYRISLNAGGPYTATLRLHYEDSELNGNNESAMRLWWEQNPWIASGRTTGDTANNWVEQAGLGNLASAWTLSDDANVTRWTGLVSSAWENPANWTAIQGSPQAPPSTNDIVALGDAAFGNQPTIGSAAQVRLISFGSAQSVALTLATGGLLAVAGNGGDIAGTWTNNRSHTINVGAQQLAVGGALRLSDGTNGHAIHLNIGSGTVTTAGDLVQSGGANIVFAGAGALNIGGSFDHVDGTFTAAASTVTYTGASAQVVAGGIAYHNLSFNKSGGTASMSAPADVGGHFNVAGAGSVTLGAPLNIASNLTTQPGTTLEAGGSPLAVGGDWVVSGDFQPGGSTVLFNGSGSQSVSPALFNHVTVNNPSGSVTLSGGIVLNGDLEVAAGTLNLAGFTANRSSYGGAFILAPGGTLQIGTGSRFPSNFATRSIADASTVEYRGTSPQVVTENAYGNLTLSNGGANAKTLAGTTSIAGDVLINAGATLDGGGFLLNVGGNWINHGTFIASSSSVVLAGTAGTLQGATAFNNLTISGGYSASNDVAVGGAMTVSGTYLAGDTAQTFHGDFNASGSIASSGVVSFAGSGPQLLDLNSGFSSSGTVNFNGTNTPTFTGLSAPVLQHVNINNSGGVAPSTGWSVAGDFVVASGAGFDSGPATHVFHGGFLNDGRVSGSGTLVFDPVSAVTVRLKGSSFLNSGTVVFGGSGQIALQSGDLSLGSVTVTNTHPAGVTLDGNWTLDGDLYIATGALLNGGSSRHHTVAGNWSDDGVFNGQTSTVELNGITDIAGAGQTSFQNLVVTGTAAAADDFSVMGSLTNNGVFDSSGATVSFVGTDPSVIGGSATPTVFDGLVIAKNAAPVTLAVNISDVNALSIAGGTLDAATFSISQDPLGGALTVAAGATLRIGGAGTLPVFDTYGFDPASAVEYYGVASQTITAQNYGNLRSSSSGGRILAPAGIIGVAGVFSPGTNVYTIAGSTLNFNGAGTQTIPAFNYFNLTSSSAGGRVLDPAGTIGVAGSFIPGTNSFATSGSSVDFNGAAQTVPAFAYHHLSVSGSGTKRLGGNSTAAGNLKLSSGTLADGGFTLSVNGSVTNNAVHTGTGRILLTGGAAIHPLAGTGSYGNLDLNDPNGASLAQNNLNIGGTLGLTSGRILTGTNVVILAPGGLVNRTSGYVAGRLRKTAPTGPAALTFEVGDANAYAPIAASFGAVTTSGSLTASTTPGDYPLAIGSGISTVRSVNRYWTLSNSGTAFNNYSVVLNFTSGDVDPGANPTNFIVALKTASTWVLPVVGTRSSTSIQATGLTQFGDFVVGESSAPGQFTGIRILPNGNPELTFSGNPGQSYRIQGTTNLLAPILWADLSTNTADLNGQLLFEDLQGTGFPMRFYRSATP